VFASELRPADCHEYRTVESARVIELSYGDGISLRIHLTQEIRASVAQA
jgi:hypothetical protein